MNGKNNEDQLKKDFPFDLYGRLATIGKIINANRKPNQVFRILDIGGQGNALKNFLPKDRVYYMDLLIESDDENFISGDGCNIPLEDESFDWVTSTDVFEHIPEGNRDAFLSENLRVAKDGMILAAPFYSEEVRQAEINVNENYKILSEGDDHFWLKEHIENGLPKKETIEEFLNKNKLSFQLINNNDLILWEILLNMSNIVSIKDSKDVAEELKKFNFFYNNNIFPLDSSKLSYRKVYFIKKNTDLKNIENREKPIDNLLYLETIKKAFDLINKINMQNEKGQKSIKTLKLGISKMKNFYVYLKNGIKYALSNPKKFIRKYTKKPQKLYLSAIFSLKSEGLKVAFIRTIHFIFHGKGVLQKSEIKKKSSDFEKEAYCMGHINLLNIEKIDGMDFNKCEEVKVSIIIPVFNKWKYTYNCLKSLKNSIKDVDYEIIVIDDGSTDETQKMIDKLSGVVYLKNEENLGFVGSCNAGAKKARGEFVVFLNNDTSVKENWLNALLETFEKNEKVGLAGSKLIYPDGRLQEAGGIIWTDKNAWNYGRLKNPKDPEFNYLKDADYCSGASIMLIKSLFNELGGFDQIYSPGYYEDTDLAFRVRQMGYRVVYQPKSELYHFEGITSGTDLGEGMKKYQLVNAKTFFDRWADVLSKENFISGTQNLFLARDRSKNKKIILFMDNNVPAFDKDAGSFISFKYLESMVSLGYKIIFWPHSLNFISPYTEILQQLGIEVVYGRESFKDFIRENGKFISFSFVNRPHVADEYIDYIKKYSKSKIFYIAQDLHFLREERIAKLEKNKLKKKMSLRTKELEKEIIGKADKSLFFSDKEVIMANELSGKTNSIIAPWVQEVFKDSKNVNFDNRKDIVFVGGFSHMPNIDAVKWFHSEVFPDIKKDVPEIKVLIIGSNPTEEILNFNSSNFKILGFVSDEERDEYLKKARVFIAPLRVGAGFKGKIALSMAHGLPVVTTDIGAEGIGLVDGESAMIANNPNEFAEKLLKLYKDKNVWENISNNGYNHVKEKYSLQKIREYLINLLR